MEIGLTDFVLAAAAELESVITCNLYTDILTDTSILDSRLWKGITMYMLWLFLHLKGPCAISYFCPCVTHGQNVSAMGGSFLLGTFDFIFPNISTF